MTGAELKELLLDVYQSEFEASWTDFSTYELGVVDPNQGEDVVTWLLPDKTLLENFIQTDSIVSFLDRSEYDDDEGSFVSQASAAPVVMTPDDVEGFLLKAGSGFGKGTKRRWFTTVENRLYYFKNKGDADPIGVIPLTRESAVTPCPNKTMFEVKANNRVYKLQADSTDDAELWLTGLNNLNKFYQDNPNLLATVKEGYLFKKGGAKQRGWKRRLFVLRQGFMYYYHIEASGSQHLKGKIPLLDAFVESLQKLDRPHCFHCVTKARTYILSAATEAEMNSWIEDVRKEIESVGADINSIAM
eukprot:TRINITY_DN1673_c0_g2_i1.p2 TRINITY_DN1673_c0_g2~~TRINITY_DN1673_c0_g2_i1.p2  ORF type:complete len:302 (-),score=99.97 TRINITY_DN1673_c0_g2_i1:34-939(-)